MVSNYNESAIIPITSYMRSKGITDKGIAGLLGNLYVESGMFPNNLQNSYNKSLNMTDEEYTMAVDNGSYNEFATDRAGYGIYQLTSSGRKQGYLDYAHSKNVSISDLQTQIEYLYKELALSYKNVLNVLVDENSTISDCARIVMTKFERPKNQSEENQLKRVGYAEDFYNKYFSDDNTKKDKPMDTVIVALSAGHYKYTSGKRCLKSIDPNETREWYLNDRIADLVEKKLADYNVMIVRLDDTTGEKLIDLPTRKMIAEKAKAKIYIAVHHNAGVNGGSGGGTVVYYYPTEPNKKQAQRLYDSILNHTKLYGNRSQRIKSTTSLYEVSAPTMDSYLIENGFMDSTTDVPIILTQEHAEKTALGIVEFLIADYGLKKLEDKPVEDNFAISENVPVVENELKVDYAESKNAEYKGTYITNTEVNVRYGAGITKAKICTLPKNTLVKCYGYYTKVLGVDWYYIQFSLNNKNIVGFICSKYIEKV